MGRGDARNPHPQGCHECSHTMQQLFTLFQITGVEIAFWESIFTQFTGPQLLDYPTGDNSRDPIIVVRNDPTADLQVPFTPLLGLQIAPKAFPHFGGTGGLYLCKSGKNKQVLLLTA